MVEIRPVKGLAPDLEDVSSCYQISSAGILYGIRGNPTHPSFDKDGYLIAGLSRWPNKTNKYIRLHKLVALAFMPNYIEAAKRGMEIDHKDGDKQNNDISNLRLVTSSENKRNPNTRKNTRAMKNAIPTKIVSAISGKQIYFESAKEASKYLDVGISTIRKAQKKRLESEKGVARV